MTPDTPLFTIDIIDPDAYYALEDGAHTRFMDQDELDALHAVLGEHCSVCNEEDG